MAQTVNSAFSEFLTNIVNLDSEETITARKSRDNLIENICDFSGDDDFFIVFKEHNLKFGSFARRTKIQPLDDIDLLICFSASNNGQRRTYYESYDGTIYLSGIQFDIDNLLVTPNTTHLNSTKVINRLIKKLSCLHDYSKADMHKNKEAGTLKLKSYTWNFDIVPCFITDTGMYLIPDGNGNWKKTDPRIDNERTSEINQKHNGQLLNIIRIMKYWNYQKHTIRIPSYLLECMILAFYEKADSKDKYWIDLEVRDLFEILAARILNDVPDPKGIQGNLNMFSFSERYTIKEALHAAYQKASKASHLEMKESNPKAAINMWKEVFGNDFPSYTS